MQLYFSFYTESADEDATLRAAKDVAHGARSSRGSTSRARGSAPATQAHPPTRARSSVASRMVAPHESLVRARAPRGIDHHRPMQMRYDAVVRTMLDRYELNVRRWRTALSGVATLRTYHDGRQERWLESPYPSSPLRMAIFLHEVGHHAIGLGVHRPRCLEEYFAWEWSLLRMREFGFAVFGVVARRFVRSMRYEVNKAVKRGLRALPSQLEPFQRGNGSGAADIEVQFIEARVASAATR